jgi:UDPglucose 6-dehydrogenase
MSNINIIGHGYVGGALAHLCRQNNIEYNVYDIEDKETDAKIFTKDLTSLILHSENNNNINYYFICVPTPSNDDGSCNVSIVENIIKQLNNECNKKSIVVIKSTLVPGTCRYFSKKYTNIDIILYPEFLREDTFVQDFYNARFVLLGTDQNIENAQYVNLLCFFRKLYSHNPMIDIYIKTFEECEIFKYSLNVYLAVKIWHFNEVYEICKKMGVSYENVKFLYSLDPRIGKYGIQVPGPDGKFGFGKSCLPKETRGMMKLQDDLGINNNALKSIMERNYYFRNKD